MIFANLCMSKIVKYIYMKKEKIPSKKESVLFAFREIVENKKMSSRYHTVANYVSFINKLSLYLGERKESFSLHELNEEWVGAYIEWLHEKHPNKPQTVDFYFRGLRSLFNTTMKIKEYSNLNIANPFIGIYVKKGVTPKRALSVKMLSKLLNPELVSSLSDSQKESLDILLVSLYCRGMVFHDIYNLRWDMISDFWQIEYCRSKTGQSIRLTVPREGQEIMLRYKKNNNLYVFPFLREKNNKTVLCEKSALRRINRHALVIGQMLRFPYKLTTYVMRHSWATLMLEAGKSVEIISQCMGHTSIRTTQIYLSSISTTKVDREVNDMLNRFIRSSKKGKGKYRKNLYTSVIP